MGSKFLNKESFPNRKEKQDRIWRAIVTFFSRYAQEWNPAAWKVFRFREGWYLVLRFFILYLLFALISNNLICNVVYVIISILILFDILVANISISFATVKPLNKLRSFFLTLFAFTHVIIVYAIFYKYFKEQFEINLSDSQLLYFSGVTITTLGDGRFLPAKIGTTVQLIVILELLTGLLFISGVIARIINSISNGTQEIKRFTSMISLTDEEMKAILQTVPVDRDEEGKFLGDFRFFPGRSYDPFTKKVVQPQESLKSYEHTLLQIYRSDPPRYARMHKGTPFYLMGWLAYEMKDYEKGVFYMDAALSEDVSNFPSKWTSLPAAAFIFLDDSNYTVAAREITSEIKHEVSLHLDRFSKHARVSLDTDALTNKFFKPNASDASYRSIMTSLWTFLLEGKDRADQLQLRSSHGGTLEPFITHLFKGCLIFESLLKKKYCSAGITLEKYLPAAKDDLGLINALLYKTGCPYKFDDLPKHINNWKSEAFQDRAVAIVYAVRNTSGHDLGWQDVFTNEVYYTLYEGIINAIFWTLKNVYKI